MKQSRDSGDDDESAAGGEAKRARMAGEENDRSRRYGIVHRVGGQQERVRGLVKQT